MTTQFLEAGKLPHCLLDFLNKKATYFAQVGNRLDCFKTTSYFAKINVLLLTLFRNCTRQILSVLMKNCQWETESKHVRQIHFRFYRLAICPPSLAKTQRTTIKRTNRSNLRKIRIEGNALSMHLQNWVRIYIHNRHNRSCRELLSVYADHCLTNVCTNSGYAWFLSLKYNRYRICQKMPNG